MKDKLLTEEDNAIINLLLDSFVLHECPLCEGDFTEVDIKLHKMFGLHTTNGKCWKPEKGHKDYQLHLKTI